jgi:hypothetical protein
MKESSWKTKNGWKGIIIMDPQEIRCESLERIHLAQDIIQMRAAVNTVMNIRVPQKMGNEFTN